MLNAKELTDLLNLRASPDALAVVNAPNQTGSREKRTLTTADWPGHSGRVYKMFLNPIGSPFREEPGIYIFSKLFGPSWQAVYIGETENLKNRLTTNLDEHDQIQRIRKHGATHVFALIVRTSKQLRLKAVMDLSRNFDPPCSAFRTEPLS